LDILKVVAMAYSLAESMVLSLVEQKAAAKASLKVEKLGSQLVDRSDSLKVEVMAQKLVFLKALR
jgi:hypothetical protein